MDYISEPGHDARLNEAENTLLIYRKFEAPFNAGQFVLMPVDANERIRRWKVAVTDNEARDRVLSRAVCRRLPAAAHAGVSPTLKLFDGCQLEFQSAFRPASCFLYFHFIGMMLRMKEYARQGYKAVLDKLKTGYP